MFQDSGIILSEKIFSDFQTNLSAGIAMRSQRQKRPLLVIREGGLSLFGSHKKGTGARVSHCDARVPVEVKNFLSKTFFLVPVQLDSRSVLGHSVLGQDVSGAGRHGVELRGAGRHWGNIPGAGGQWGMRFWGRNLCYVWCKSAEWESSYSSYYYSRNCVHSKDVFLLRKPIK